MTPENVQQLESRISIDEGYKEYPYPDTKGKITIGIGYNLTDNLGVKTLDEANKLYPHGMSYEDAVTIMRKFIDEITDKLEIHFPWFIKLDDIRQSVFICMAYQMGVRGLYGFSDTLDFAAKGQYSRASNEMMNSDWAREFPKRASRLQFMMGVGKWPNTY